MKNKEQDEEGKDKQKGRKGGEATPNAWEETNKA
jgi:hypothetical protein